MTTRLDTLMGLLTGQLRETWLHWLLGARCACACIGRP
jgi:hypothetical protein